ncbi:MAG: hypothetical protein KBT87_11150 [Gammaproteobacteria bacterium]|nr:hypothetical protein [Gammaproteobacteria bacterium]MBQ0775219.1 hypothetical protein [Gammaproteobacteria bacterium]
MRYVTLCFITVLLVGCGEKFDASSDNMIAVSYNGILNDLDEEDKDRFVRLYDLYTQPYDGPYDPIEGGGIDIRQNDIESLHGLSYNAVISRVEEHEAYRRKIEREADIRSLEYLHKDYLDAQERITNFMKVFPATVDLVMGPYSEVTGISFAVENGSESILTKFDINIKAIRRSTGEVALTISKKAGLSKGALKPGYISSFTLQNDELQRYLKDKNYSVKGFITNMVADNGHPLHISLSNEFFREYGTLQLAYPEEFEALPRELDAMYKYLDL